MLGPTRRSGVPTISRGPHGTQAPRPWLEGPRRCAHPRDVRLQVLIVVDLEGTFGEGELTSVLPHERDDRRVFALTAHGAPRIERQGPDAQPIDWLAIGHAVEEVARLTRAAAEGHELHLYVGGQGPLPVFAHLGYSISKFTGRQSIIARKQGGGWDVLPLATGDVTPDVFTGAALPSRQSPSTGQIAVYVDTAARAARIDALRAAVDLTGDRLGDVVELRTEHPLTVTTDNAGSVAAELVTALGRVPGFFPHAAGMSLFIAGPTALAFAVGRAVNPTIVATVQLFNFVGGQYAHVYGLPFADDRPKPLPQDEEAIADRGRVRDVLLSAINELKNEVAADDLTSPLLPGEHEAFLRNLAALTYVESDADEFSLSIAGGTFSFGAGLLEALRGAELATQQRFAKLLMLHELFHEHQNVRSTNYYEVGRAGVVLESVDYVADVFALRVMTRSVFRRSPPTSPETTRAMATEWFDAATFGIHAFDQLEHGARIQRLADRRLRRYLTWHLQRVRVEAVDTPADVETVLAATVTAELAPVEARVDRRSDRQVVAATPRTEFFAAVGGRLVRHAKRPGFDPADLVEAVRGFNQVAIQRLMRFVVEENKPVLIPWRT